MSIIGQYRYSASTSGATHSEGLVNIGAFRISGLQHTAGIAVCLYKWSPTINAWIPYT